MSVREAEAAGERDPAETARVASAKINAHDFRRIAEALGYGPLSDFTIDDLIRRITSLQTQLTEAQ